MTNQKKIEILEEAENTGNLKVVARKYGVCPKSIRDWRKNKLKIKENIANGRSESRHCKWQVGNNRFPEMEMVLSAWVTDAREQGFVVSRKLMSSQALNLLQEMQIPHESFKASMGWVVRFMERHHLTTRTVSTLNQHVPLDVSTKCVRFLLYMRKIMEENCGLNIWATDETPIFYDLIGKKTIDKIGKLEVKIKTSGGDKKLITCLPVASIDGTKKPTELSSRGRGKQRRIRKF